jgi:large subunit ribosomal protein L32
LALPKRRHSKARGRKRRTHYRLDLPNLGECPKCHAKKLPHQVCPECGMYGDRLVSPPKPKKEAQE